MNKRVIIIGVKNQEEKTAKELGREMAFKVMKQTDNQIKAISNTINEHDRRLIDETRESTAREIFNEFGKYIYKIRCLPFQGTKIVFIRIPQPTFQAIKARCLKE